MTIRDDLLGFIKENLLRSSVDVGPDDSLIELGIVDSLGLMQLITYIEETFAVRVPDGLVRPDNFQSVVAMERMVESLREG